MRLTLCLLAAIFLPLLGCSILPAAGRTLGRRVGWLALGFPALSTIALVWAAASLEPGARSVVSWPWIPSLGLDVSFLVDGLSLFFGLVVSGVGVLIFFYAIFYLDDHYEHHGRFYAYLTLFMAAMLGTVLSNHLILLFVFWELTGISSFLLIGFLHETTPARVGARQALLVTGTTGLLMLGGLILLTQSTGAAHWSDLLDRSLPWADHGSLLTIAMVLIVMGAFGKSAQVPLHFWLPNAMAAPTPVSAYLHAATMVKLGVFLVARIFPMFAGQDAWAAWLVPIGFTTMVLGALFALLSHDLKAILAYSTVSALGSFIGYYGIGQPGGVHHDILHITTHVFYKGCLFMVAGIVTHATGLRDIRQLGGLFGRMPLLGLITLIGCASMAGLPGTIGFISKEAMIQEVFQASDALGPLAGYAAGALVLASLLKIAFAIRFFWQIFLGPEPEAVGRHFHAPPKPMLWPPLLLAATGLAFGLLPSGLDPLLHKLATPGLNPEPHPLAFWHGLTRELYWSAIITAAGALLFWAGRATQWRWARIPAGLRVDHAFERGLNGLMAFSRAATRALGFDRPQQYVPVLLGFLTLLVGGYLVATYGADLTPRSVWTLKNLLYGQAPLLRLFVAVLMALAVLGVVGLKRWTTQLIFLSASGFLLTFYFVIYQAPDLALTQILVDTVSLLLMLILLGRFPRGAEQGDLESGHSRVRNVLNGVVAAGVGLTMTGLVLLMTFEPHPDKIGPRFLATTVGLAGGTNAVNTILVDYRGLDTLFEITVLFIAMLACLGLLMRRKRDARQMRQGPLAAPDLRVRAEDRS